MSRAMSRTSSRVDADVAPRLARVPRPARCLARVVGVVFVGRVGIGIGIVIVIASSSSSSSRPRARPVVPTRSRRARVAPCRRPRAGRPSRGSTERRRPPDRARATRNKETSVDRMKDDVKSMKKHSRSHT
jgi:hypothetical protein